VEAWGCIVAKLDLSLSTLKRLSKIVLIEDQVETFPLALLRDEGYSIDHWPTVKDLSRLEARQYDVVILDIHGVADQWSEQDGGLAVLQHLKTKVPGLAIVAFSGLSFDLERHRFFQLADDVLCKPVDAVKCKQVIDGVLQTHFTPTHIWGTIKTVLQSNGKSEKELQKLENEVAQAMSKTPNRLIEVVEKVAPYVKASVTAASLVAKLATLAQGG
jgi:CheY-like chemotaxis protein